MLNQFLKQRHQQKFQQALLLADEAALRKIISKETDIDSAFAIANEEEKIPLLHAIQVNSVGCLMVLLERGAAIPQQAPLQLALMQQTISAEAHQLALLTVLLEFGFDPNIEEGLLFFHCLTVDDRNLQLLLITRLMEHGGQINVRDSKQRSVLDYLMLAEQTQLVGSLISAGAELTEQLDQLACSDEIKAFATRKKQDLEIQRMLMGR